MPRPSPTGEESRSSDPGSPDEGSGTPVGETTGPTPTGEDPGSSGETPEAGETTGETPESPGEPTKTTGETPEATGEPTKTTGETPEAPPEAPESTEPPEEPPELEVQSSLLAEATGWEGFGGNVLPPGTWHPYALTSPFNLSTAGGEVVANSAAYVKEALSWGMPATMVAGNAGQSDDWGHPTFYAQYTDPVYTLEATKPWGYNALDGLKIRIPAKARPAGSKDGHMTVISPGGMEYDFWQATVPPAGGGTFNFSWGGRTRVDGSGLGSGGTASGFGNLAGMIRAPELAAGHINHALFIVLKCTARDTNFGFGAKMYANGMSSYVYPATDGGTSCPEGTAGAVPLGTRFELAMTNTQISELSVPGWKKTILRALAHYGGYVGDTGGPGFTFMFESSTTYTALGLPDRLVQFAQNHNVPYSNGRYHFEMGSGVEWEKYLRVLAPPAH